LNFSWLGRCVPTLLERKILVALKWEKVVVIRPSYFALRDYFWLRGREEQVRDCMMVEFRAVDKLLTFGDESVSEWAKKLKSRP